MTSHKGAAPASSTPLSLGASRHGDSGSFPRVEKSSVTHHIGPDQAATGIFPLFVVLYATAFMMMMVEAWRFPAWTAAGVMLSMVTIALAKQRIFFLIFLISTTAYFLLFRFPDVANHINLLVFCNILLMLGLAYSYISHFGRKDFARYFEALLSPVRLMLVVTFTVAGFHKLNYDFLNPDVSCIRGFLNRFIWTLTRPLFDERVPAIPVLAVLLLVAASVLLLIWRYRLGRLPWLVLLGGVVLIVAANVSSSASFFAAVPQSLFESQIGIFILGIGALVVFWQLVEGLLLMVPRLQAFFLCFALLFHTYLGMIGFVDFQSLAVALLLAFVPKPVLEAWGRERYFRLGTLRFDRVHAYVGLNLLAGFLNGLHYYLTPLFKNIDAMQGILFNGGVLILIWPILFALMSNKREWRWRGVSVFDSRTPKFLYLLPLLLLFFGMTSYLGLRTAGNFSMFSNLRTEGATSNHIILGNNPLKIWGYQEDIVRVLELKDWVDGGRYSPDDLQGMQLPVVEFRKAISELKTRGITTPIVFEYQGKVYTSDDIAADATWHPGRSDWEMKLLDFRAIQPEGPNECRW